MKTKHRHSTRIQRKKTTGLTKAQAKRMIKNFAKRRGLQVEWEFVGHHSMPCVETVMIDVFAHRSRTHKGWMVSEHIYLGQ